jgi:hypothetical protein
MKRWPLSALCVLLPVFAASPAVGTNVGCMVYNNGLRFSEKELRRLEEATEIQYVGVQMTGPGPHDREVASRLARSGKKLIVQIWWGPDSPHSWSRFAMANIALDARLRQEFFGEVVDPVIESIGPENIHTVHLLEETAGQFATDALVPGDPEDYSDDAGGGYSSPYYTGYSGNDTYGGPWILPLRRHHADFRRFGGYDLFAAAVWTGPEWGAFRRWVGQRVQALANVRFAAHLHARYPTILATTWDGPNFGGVTMADTPAMLGAIDGFTANCYMQPLQNYIMARTIRALDHDKTFQFMTWVGRDNLNVNARRAMLTSIYAVGSDVIHLWEEPQRAYARDDLWAIMQPLYGTFSHLPVFRHRPEVFVICSRWDVPSCFLKDFDSAHFEDAEGFGLGRYRLVLLDGADHPGLRDWVTGGGTAVSFDRRPAFLSDAEVDGGTRVEQGGFLATTVRHGKGTILLLARGKTDVADSGWQVFVYDRLQELATATGLQAVFAQHFAPRESGGRYLEITSADGAVTCYVHYGVGQEGPPVQVKGLDVLSGATDPVLGPTRSAAIVAHVPLTAWSPPPLPDRSTYARRAEPGARRGQPELRELPPGHALGPAAAALAPAPPPRAIGNEGHGDWAVAACRYRVALRFSPEPVAVKDQPIVFTGQQVFRMTGLNDLAWGSVRLFCGAAEQPVQVDERDGTGHYLATGNGRLDADDELVFRVSLPARAAETCHLYCDTTPSGGPAWPAAAVTFEAVSTDIGDALLSNGRLAARLKGPARKPGANDISNYGAGAITECSLDGKPFTRIRDNWSNYFFANPWSTDAGWSLPEKVVAGPLRSIVRLRLPEVTQKDQTGQITLRGKVDHYYALYGAAPVLDLEQRLEYPWSDRRWSAQYVFYATVGHAPDAQDVLWVPVAGAPVRVALQDAAVYGNRYLEHRPEQGWMAALDPVEKHGCALFYARMDEVRENLACVDYGPARELTPSVARWTDGYPLRVDYTNRVMQSADTLVRRFRVVGLTDEDGQMIAAQYRIWGEDPLRLAEVEFQHHE